MNKRHRVTYNSKEDDQFIIHKESYLIYFTCRNNGSYYYNLNNINKNLSNVASDK